MNKLDFNKLVINFEASEDEPKLSFTQLRDHTSRPGEHKEDPIVKTVIKKVGSINYAICLRKSGMVDIYCNMTF